jgi:zinc transporter ZupT
VADRIQNLQETGHVSAEIAGSWTTSAYKRFDDQTTVGITPELVQSETGQHGHAAMAIWMGIALDAIPESVVIGMLVVAAAAQGTTLSLAFIAGVFLANLPEAMSSAVTMQKGGMTTMKIFWMWFSLCLLTGVGAMIGSVILPANPSGSDLYIKFAFEGLAGGAMLTMIAQTMLPEAFEQGGGPIVGLSTLGGFLAALMVKMI